MFNLLTSSSARNVARGVAGFAVVHVALDLLQWSWRKARTRKAIVQGV